jgi:hypothetical protein
VTTAAEPRARPVAVPVAVDTESQPPARGGRRGPSLETLYTLAFAVAGWAVGIAKLGDNSFFWHLRTGRLILERGIPHSDPYSFTAHGARWVAQSWLAELWYGVLDRIAGGAGIRIFGAVLGATLAVLSFRLALRIVHDRARALGVGIGAFGCLAVLWSPRPMVIAALLFLALVWIVECPTTWLGRHELLAVPALMWLWANVHGTFELGLVYIALHVVGRWADGARPWEGRERRLVVAMVLAAVVVFLNPYGPALIFFPVELLSRGKVLRHVVEWRSPDFRALQGQMLAAWLVVVVCVLARTRHRVSRRDVIVAVPFLLLAFWAQRNVALVGFATLPIVARALARTDGVAPSTPATPGARRIGYAVVAGVVALMVGLSAQAFAETPYRTAAHPVKAMQAVERAGLLGRRIAAPDGWGGYIILKYWPRQRVFVDDRFDMYPVGFMSDYVKVLDSGEGWQQMLQRFQVDVVVWPNEKALAQVLDASPGWIRIHRDQLGAVFVRRDLATRLGLH